MSDYQTAWAVSYLPRDKFDKVTHLDHGSIVAALRLASLSEAFAGVSHTLYVDPVEAHNVAHAYNRTYQSDLFFVHPLTLKVN